jgi:hypothetical protein
MSHDRGSLTEPARKYLRVVWLCEKGDRCTNKEEPGRHYDYKECRTCWVGLDEPLPAGHIPAGNDAQVDD